MGTKLERIAEISAETKKPVFTSIYHLINAELLKQCHKELDGKKAVGVDKVTKEEYGKNLDRNIEDLVQRLKNKSFKPLPSLRVYIPKGNGKMRPLGIASYEDKIVQMAVKKVLEAIYEPRFLNCMYGFRPNRGCHEAVKELYQRMQNTDCQLFGDSVEEELLLNGKGSTQEQRDDLLKLYGLFEWKERHPATLSGGQKQRLTLAVSDWIDTPVLILDEPTSGLDFKNMMRISEHLKALAQKGKTILIITHDYEFAAMTCNRVLHFVDEGHVETFPLQENLSRLYSCLMCQ